MLDSSNTNGGLTYPNSSISEQGLSSVRSFPSSSSARSHSPTSTAQSHYSQTHPPPSSHHPSGSHFSQMSNGSEISSHPSYNSSGSNHITGTTTHPSLADLRRSPLFQCPSVNRWTTKARITVILLTREIPRRILILCKQVQRIVYS